MSLEGEEMRVQTHTQREDHIPTGRRWPLTNQGERPQKKPTLLARWSWTSSLQDSEKWKVCCLSHQPQQTNTPFISKWTYCTYHTRRLVYLGLEGLVLNQDSGIQEWLLHSSQSISSYLSRCKVWVSTLQEGTVTSLPVTWTSLYPSPSSRLPGPFSLFTPFLPPKVWSFLSVNLYRGFSV